VVIRVARKPSAVAAEEEDPGFFEQMPEEFRRWFERRRKGGGRKEGGEEEQEDGGAKEPVFDGQGSGVVMRKEGYILTNRHVVDGAEKIKVLFQDGTEVDGEIRGSDAQSDVAVVRIKPGARELPVARFADSDKVRVGEFAIAIGTPFELDHSVTVGHVSAKGRSQVIRTMGGSAMDQDFIQTDANINPGNSGGPLLNIEGEVIGINTLIRGMNTGIGFAIPSNLAREIAEEIVAEGKFVRGYLGVRINALRDNPDYRVLVPGLKEGVIVEAIMADGPAAKSALKAGDIITAVEGRRVGSPQQLRNEIRGKKVGTVITLDVHRLDAGEAGSDLKVKVKPQAWPGPAAAAATPKPAARENRPARLGLTVESVTQELAEEHGVDKADGVIVTEVEKGSPAERKGLRPGDIITDVNHKPVRNPREFREALQAADAKRGVLLNFLSRGNSKFEILRESGE
jgi:serine protease Do